MSDAVFTQSGAAARARLHPLFLIGPVTVIFLSANLANAGNLAFNMLFSRWMGPELFGELAELLTIKLAVLALLNAVQMAVSRHVAEGRPDLGALKRLNSIALLAGFAALPVIAMTLWVGGVGEALGLSHPGLLLILAAALPFATPLCLARGVALGRVAVKSTVLSTQVEMVVRLGLGALAWQAGFGIEGVTVAIGLSILAGWSVIGRDVSDFSDSAQGARRLAEGLALAALPFGLLQAAQVILLDGEVILARLWLEAEDSGHAAALSLFQRIAFFASFGLASVLLPVVARAHSRSEPVVRAILPVAALFCAVSLPLVLGAVIIPETLLRLVVGPDYLAAAPLLWKAAVAAIAFTASYLLATALAASSDYRGIALVAMCVPLQIGMMMMAAYGAAPLLLAELLTIKLICQLGLLAALLGTCVQRFGKFPISLQS